MHRRGRASLLLAAATIVLAGVAAGCATREPPRQVVLVRTPIQDFKAVAGRWSGVLVREPASDEEDWLQLTINADGTFVGQVVRPIGALIDRGTFSLRDGNLTWSASDGGTVLCALFVGDGRRSLRLDARSPTGPRYRADLLPAR